uniref:AMP-binding protein n=1 Tax=Ningiella ruwaisensis TaxID=2364274 RepID=UPI0010A0301F|nr:class I adenylate-forming enzyme family protein [Ningiella ruwaisensis]
MRWLSDLSKIKNHASCAIIDVSSCSHTQVHFSYSDLHKRALHLRASYPHLYNQCIAISARRLSDFVSALFAFEGHCAAIYLLPKNGLSDKTRSNKSIAAGHPKQENNLVHETYNLPEYAQLFIPERADTQTLKSRQAMQNEGLNQQSTSKVSLDTQFYLATSGTSGKAKWIGHNTDSLTKAIKLKPQLTDLRWALCYEPSRFAGLQVVLQSMLSGASLLDCSEGDFETRANRMLLHKVNAISCTPSFWRQLLMQKSSESLELQHITLGGEIADHAILRALSHRCPEAKLMHIYASTELGVGFAVSDKQAGFPDKWLSEGVNGHFLKIDAQNHLRIKPNIALDKALAPLIDENGYYDTGDLVSHIKNRVIFLGRASGLINVGGAKVSPEEVEHVLLASPLVQQAKVYGKANSVLGQLVAADIVLKQPLEVSTSEAKQSLLTLSQNNLARHKIPRIIHFVSAIDANDSGKIMRHRAADETAGKPCVIENSETNHE